MSNNIPPAGVLSGFRPDIEGLRAIAILLVALYHAGLPLLPGGFIGVDIFFVLSGYLITALLIKEIETSGSVNFLAFYARRARRLLPAAACVVIVTLLLAQFIYAPQELVALAKDAITTSLYASNLWFAHISTDYLAADAAKSPLLHTWSLSVEEQFYFVWPLFILLALRGRQGAQTSRKRLLIAMLAMALASLLLSIWLTGVAQPWAFFASPARAWEFAIGGLATFIPTAWMAARPQLARLLFWGGLLAVAIAATRFGYQTAFPGIAALLPVLGTAMVLVCHVPGQPGHGRLLGNPLLQWIGKRSYSWYLWHWPVLVLAGYLYPDKTLAMGLACLVLALGLAELSYRLVENPVRFNPLLLSRPGYSLAAACCLTLLCAGSSEWWRHAGGREAASPDQIKFTRAMTDVPKQLYNSNCHLSLLDVATDDCIFGDPDSRTTVVLFGDSHAAQWFPAVEALARQQHWRLVSLTKSSCPVAWLRPLNRQLGRPYEECSQWREQVVQKIIALQPSVVMMGYYRYVSAAREAGAESINDASWQQGMHHTLELFEQADIPVAIMRDSLRPGFNVPTCLARQAKTPWRDLDCSFPLQPALDTVEHNLNLRAAADMKHVSFVDLNNRICTSAECDPVDSDSGIVLFRDSHHLTTEFVRHIAPDLNTKLLDVIGRRTVSMR